MAALSSAPLMRLTLIRMAADTYRLIWTHHHLLADGWSMPLLLDEVFTDYEAIAQLPGIAAIAPITRATGLYHLEYRAFCPESLRHESVRRRARRAPTVVDDEKRPCAAERARLASGESARIACSHSAMNSSGSWATLHQSPQSSTSGSAVDTTGRPALRYSRSLIGLTCRVSSLIRNGMMPTEKPRQYAGSDS